MDANVEEMAVPPRKIRQMYSGKWYVNCKLCRQEARLQAPNEDDDENGNDDDCVPA